MRILRRIFRAILILVAVVVAIPLLGLAYGFLATDAVPPAAAVASDAPPPAVAERIRAEIPGYQRPEESTYLTYPEWTIVYAAREYRDFTAERSPSDFPYWASIGRYWRDYATMIRATANYPFNFSNHLMLVVIGTSHTAEHAAQWAYENTIGRLTGFWQPVEEDHFQHAVAAEYATFLNQVPWYEFDYAGRRADLWAIEPASGAPAIRSWERKLGFGLSYTIKQAYAGLIKSGLAATSDPAALEIFVWARGPVAEAIAGEPETRTVLDLGDDGLVFVTQRYQRFTELAPRLIEKGVSFVEIGGNDEMLATVLSEGALTPFEGTRTLFSDPLPSDRGTVRTGLTVPVSALSDVLPALEVAGARLEHLYDY